MSAVCQEVLPVNFAMQSVWPGIRFNIVIIGRAMRREVTTRELQHDGFFVVVIGQRTHVEVQGIGKGLSQFEIVGTVEEVRPWPHPRLGIVCQTAMPPHLAEEILAQR